MGDVIVLRTPVDLTTDAGHQFVVDAVRAGEGLVTDSELQRKYELVLRIGERSLKTPHSFVRFKPNARGGCSPAKLHAESAAKHHVAAPGILAKIMENELSNPRHVIEASKELRATAAGSGDSDSPTNSEKFLIVINLGEDCVVRQEVDLVPKKSIQIEGEPDVDE